ncbi:RNA 3'-phosphate cyclase [candidate division WOR-3 bacterium]|nr:RNA 3'-phosphate cyclase [candidate division WOR-3 bacterium]
MIEIDGSYGEGGGQILRTALALSAITKKPLHISNIRKGRRVSGLLQQHLTCVRAAGEITNAKLKGDGFRSQELWFEPNEIKGGNFSFDVARERGSAGATTLVLQTILPILLYADKLSVVKIKGGTHTKWSPPFHYISWVLQPTLKKLGIGFSCSLKKCGFYPIGKGEIEVKTEVRRQKTEDRSQKTEDRSEIKGIELIERGKFRSLNGISVVAGLPLSIAKRQREEAFRCLKDFSPKIEVSEVSAYSKGTFFFLLAKFENTVAGFSAIGERGKPAEKVAKEACDKFLYYYNSEQAVEQWLADQIILFLALTSKSSCFTTSRISKHLLTNIWVIRQFLDIKIEVTGEFGSPGKIAINTEKA